MPTNPTHTHIRRALEHGKPFPLLDEALAYAGHGYLIFPLWHVTSSTTGNLRCVCSDGPQCGSPGKHPRTRFGLTEATCDPAVIAAWWRRWPFANIGMPAGANRLAVIDVDPDHGGTDTITVLDQYVTEKTRGAVDLWATRVIDTGGGGWHLIYQAPEGGIKSGRNTFGDDAPGVDTRGRGGYIVAPPSLHPAGRRYTVRDNGHTIAPWPDCLTPLLEQAPRDESRLPEGVIACGPPGAQLTAGDRGTVWAYAALLEESKKIADWPIAEGSGKNDALNASAYKLGRRVGAGYIDEASCAHALYQAASRWIGHGHTERSIRATIRSGLAAGIRNPHPGPATRGGAS